MPASNLNAAFQFSRQFGVPLDKDFVFQTSSARTNYLTNAATSGLAYVGMIVADAQTNEVYILDSNRNWKEVGVTVAETFGANNSGILIKSGVDSYRVGGLNSGSNINITNPSGLSANPTINLNTNLAGLASISVNNLTVSGSGLLSSNINNFTSAVNDLIDNAVSTSIVAGSGINTVYDSIGNTLTISSPLTAGNGISLMLDPVVSGAYKISAVAVPVENISDFDERVDDRVANLLTQGSGIGLNYNDNANTLQVAVTGIPSSLVTNFNSSVSGLVNGIYVPVTRTITPGSGLIGSTPLDLSNNITLDIGGGEGISVESNQISVDNTVVRTTGTQTIANIKTFSSGIRLSAQTADRIAGFDIDKNLVSLDTQLYPSLLELSYVKGLTSDVQTQINSKTNNSTTITAGSGLVGGGNLTTDRTFDIGQGDGISVSSDSISVNSTVVRTSGDQTISGVKTFAADTMNLVTNLGDYSTSNIIIGNPNNNLGISYTENTDYDNIGTELLIGHNTNIPDPSNPIFYADSSSVGIRQYNGNQAPQKIKFVINSSSSSTRNVTIRANSTNNSPTNAIFDLPTNGGGTLARTSDINTSQITGILPVSKGGTGRTTINNGQLLIGSGSVLVANTLTSGSGISISSSAGSITVNVDNTVIRTIGNQTIDGQLIITSGLNLSNSKITNLATPTQASDAANKGYVDAIKQGLDIKDSVVVATTGIITLSGIQTIDGILLTAGDRVLVKNQTDRTKNGIYVVSAGAWSRASDADTFGVGGKVSAGMFTFVSRGGTNADSGWVLIADDVVVEDTTPLDFAQFSGAGQITAGSGLTKNGNTLDVGTASSSRIVVNADNIDLATVSQSNSSGSAGINFAQTVSVDNYGRVTGVTSADVRNATTSDKGIASFDSGDFSVTNGAVSIKNSGIGNSQLENNSVTVGSTNIALGAISVSLSGLSSVTSTTFIGALSGNADTATTSTNANNIAITTSLSNINPMVFVSGTTGNLAPLVNNNLRFDASNNILLGSSNTTPTTKLEYFIIDGGTP